MVQYCTVSLIFLWFRVLKFPLIMRFAEPPTWHKEVQVAWVHRPTSWAIPLTHLGDLCHLGHLGLWRLWKMWKAHLYHLVLGLDLRVTGRVWKCHEVFIGFSGDTTLEVEWLSIGNPKHTGEMTEPSGIFCGLSHQGAQPARPQWLRRAP